MKNNSLCALATLAALALLAPVGLVQAQDVQLASHAEMNDLYARLAELESRVAAGGVGCTDAVGGGCNDCCDDCCGCPGFVGGAEILWLKAFNSEGSLDVNYNEAFRFWFGYQGAGGLGARIRYFDYDNTAAIDIRALDGEIYDAIQVGYNWDLTLGAGIRYLDATLTDDAITGVGPVVSAEVVRHISDRAGLYLIARESIVVGDGLNDGAADEDLTTAVTEIQLGGQLHRDYNGGLLFARLGWEAQAYKDLLDGEELTTLMGMSLSAGLMR